MNLSFSYNYFTIFGTRIVEVFSQSDVSSNPCDTAQHKRTTNEQTNTPAKAKQMQDGTAASIQ